MFQLQKCFSPAVHLFQVRGAHSPTKRSTVLTASWSITTSEKTAFSLNSLRVCAETLARLSVVATLAIRRQSFYFPQTKSFNPFNISFLYLVISVKVTRSPASIAAFRLCAPNVSMATMGTSSQPAWRSPSTTPLSRPPRPTDSTIAPGFSLSSLSSSFTRDVWPSLCKHHIY